MNNKKFIEDQIRYLDKLQKDEYLYNEYVSDSSSYLYSIGLTMYGDPKSNIHSYLYSEFNKSIIDPKIILHPQQIQVLNELKSNNVFLSAPTSFGKSFLILEYIAKYKPKKILITIPTLSLLDEYQTNINKIISDLKMDYSVYNNIDFGDDDIINERSIFLLTHERASSHSNWNKLMKKTEIDFSVIDEIHKINRPNFYTKNNKVSKIDGDSEIKLSKSLWNSLTSSKKILIIGPYIKSVNINSKHNIKFVKKDFKPVINDYKAVSILDLSERYEYINKFIQRDVKKMIYFSGPSAMTRYLLANEEVLSLKNRDLKDDELNKLLKWIKYNIHEDWYVYRLLERGILIHHGALPKRAREKMVKIFESKNFNTILVTSTLIDGVNTSAEELLITTAKISTKKMDNFQMGNLIGRTGRTNRHFIGKTTHILNTKSDQEWDKDNQDLDLDISIFNDDYRADLEVAKSNLSSRHLEIINRFKVNISREQFLDSFSFIGIEKLNKIIDFIEKYTIPDNFYEMKTNDLLKHFVEGAQISKREKNEMLVLVFMYNAFSLNTNINFFINAKLKSGEELDQCIDLMIKLYNGKIENQYHTSFTTLLKAMEYMEFDQKFINHFYQELILPIESKYFLNEPPVYRVMKNMGIPYETIKKAKSEKYFLKNEELRDINEISRILKSKGLKDFEI